MFALAILLLTAQVLSIGIILYLLRSTEHTKKMFSERSKAKNDFVDMTVHELRAPLTAIKDASSLLMNTKNMQDTDKEKLLRMIHDQSKFLIEQVTVLLDFAKLNQGKLTVQKVSCDLKGLLEQEVQIFLPQAQKRNMKITSHFDEHLPVFCFDQMRIAQVLNNIISNSTKYGREGGEIIVSTHVQATQGEQEIVVSVQDDGPGIPRDRQDTLFAKFSQLDNGKYNNLGSSSGLGLYVAKGIVEAHGGRIMLHSEEGHGTTVSFTLPLIMDLRNDTPEHPSVIQQESQHVTQLIN